MQRSPALQWSILAATVCGICAGLVVWGVFRPWSSIIDGLLLLNVLSPLVLLVGLAIWKRDRFLVLPPVLRPISIGLASFLLCVILVLVNAVTDLSFLWNRQQYEAAVAMLEPDSELASAPFWLKLPPDLRYLASDGDVVIFPGDDVTGWMLLFPESAEDFDGYFRAVAYISRKTGPQPLDICVTLSPLYSGSNAWYDCVTNYVRMPSR